MLAVEELRRAEETVRRQEVPNSDIMWGLATLALVLLYVGWFA